MDYAGLLRQRLRPRPLGRWDVVSTLEHFALITYAAPLQKLASIIPRDRYEVARFQINGEACGLISAVPFVDADFRFERIAPWAKFRFGQTNHRAYVSDKATGQPAVWFFGTTLGSPLVQFARALWRIPWHQARYKIDCRFDGALGHHTRFEYKVESDWCAAHMIKSLLYLW